MLTTNVVLAITLLNTLDPIVQVSVENTLPGHLYCLETATSPAGPWTQNCLFYGDQTFLDFAVQPAQFYRVKDETN